MTLFEVTGKASYFAFAKEICEIVDRDLKSEKGAYYQSKENKNLLIRKCEFYDGAEPSGNAVQSENLLRLYQLTQEKSYLDSAEDILKAAKTFIESFPPGACYHLITLQRYLDVKAPFIVIAFDENHTNEKELRQAFGSVFCPHAAFVWKAHADTEIDSLIPSIASQVPIDGKTTVYFCKGTYCEPPMTDMDQILEMIESL